MRPNSQLQAFGYNENLHQLVALEGADFLQSLGVSDNLLPSGIPESARKLSVRKRGKKSYFLTFLTVANEVVKSIRDQRDHHLFSVLGFSCRHMIFHLRSCK